MLAQTTRLGAAALLAAAPAGAQCLFEDRTDEAGLGEAIASGGDDHGPGAVFADLDGDGYPELYLMRAGPQPGNQLYRNVPAPDGGRGFQLLAGSGAEGGGQATGAIAGDIDNDGDLDLYVLNFDQPNLLLRNLLIETGELLFDDVTADSDPTPGVEDGQHGAGIAWHEGVALDNSLTAAFADVDRDGDIDLYVGNHNGWAGHPIEGPFPVPGRRDVFYMNNGDGTFCDATMELGLSGFETASGQHETPWQSFSSSNAVIFADFDNDAWIDLLVTNKVGGPTDRDMLYRNRGAGPDDTWLGLDLITYDLVPAFGHLSPAAMGVDVADWDNDGDLDIYITDWTNPADPDAPGLNDLWENRLAESGELSFVHSAALPGIYSWGAQWQDFDNDGRVDLHVATHEGFADMLYLNLDSGPVEVGALAGIDQVRDARGDVSADFDRDGWIDLFVVNRDGGPSVLYANKSFEVLPVRHHVQVKLLGDPQASGPWRSPRDAIGARLTLAADLDGDQAVEASEVQIREVVSGSSNAASTSSLEVEFGIGAARGGDLEVRWPSGRRSTFAVVRDEHLLIDEAALATGDLTGDGAVDVEDVAAVVAHWGVCPAAPLVCLDQDGDGQVNLSELLLVLLHWG